MSLHSQTAVLTSTHAGRAPQNTTCLRSRPRISRVVAEPISPAVRRARRRLATGFYDSKSLLSLALDRLIDDAQDRYTPGSST